LRKLPVVVVSTCAVSGDILVVSELVSGAFAVGDGSTYDGTTVVQRLVQLGEPVIYVNFNYCLNAFGFLGGKEALAGGAANVGLYGV
jgi:acetylcholinesterase